MMAAHVRAGGETPTMMLFSADRRMWQTHLLPRFRRVHSDDVIVVEAEAKFFGYIAQSVETIALRPLSRREALLLDVSKACLDIVMAAMKPGIAYADLIALWEKTATGVEHQPGRTMGHGLGQGQDGPLTTAAVRLGGALVEEGDCFVSSHGSRTATAPSRHALAPTSSSKRVARSGSVHRIRHVFGRT